MALAAKDDLLEDRLEHVVFGTQVSGAPGRRRPGRRSDPRAAR